MPTHADKSQGEKRQPVANGILPKQSGRAPVFNFSDNRPEAIVQRKLQEMANNSPRAIQLSALQKMANAGEGGSVVQLATLDINPLFQAKLGSVIDTGTLDESQMNGLEGQIEDLAENPIGHNEEEIKNYQKLLKGLREQVSEAFRAGDYKDGRPMVDYHRPRDPWAQHDDENWLDGAELEKKRRLVEMVKEVVNLADTMPEQLKAVMQHDEIYNLTPEGQLEYCVDASKGYDAGTLAKCLYTSYFYNPINKLLRGSLPLTVDKKIADLIGNTLEALEQTIKDDEVVHEIATLRVELQAEWIGNPGVDDVLNFPAFTSTHPSEDGVEAMLDDIGNGTFGELTKLAVLKFHGRTKILEPHIKYFPDEVETVIPAGAKARIASIKNITLEIPGKGTVQGKEYTLEILGDD